MNIGIPFFRIRKDSRVALYGCGNSGIICYKQLIKSGYCSLAVIVDTNYADKVFEGEEVKPVSELETVKYDYVLITIIDDYISQRVKNILIKRGILEDKIVTMQDRIKPPAVECLKNKGYLQEYLADHFKEMYGFAKRAGEYYQELEALLIENIEEKSCVFNYLKMLLSVLKDDEKKFILLVLMYQYDYFDKQCMELFMKCMNDSEWYDDTYYEFIIDSTVMIFVHPDYIYDNFFIDRKKLQKKICEYYNLYHIKNMSKSEKRKVAIVSSIYSPDRAVEAVSVLVRKYAMEFTDWGYDVKIFVLRHNIPCDLEKAFLVPDIPLGSPAKTTDELTKAMNIQIGEQLSTDLTERIQNTVKSIMNYQPSFILDMADERFPEAFALVQHFPIINLPIRGNAYSSEADIYLFLDRNRVKEDNYSYRAIPMERVYEVMISYLDQRETGIPYNRREYGLREEDFVMVTVGVRLQLEIDDEMIKNVCRLLSEKKNIKWILVGDNVESEDPLFNRFMAEKRIINWGREKRLEDLYQMCDIYLNPNRRGGGVSIRRAMCLGLPIAMTDFPSDALPCMPPAYIVHGDYRNLMEYVARLCENQDLYQRVSKATLRRMELFTAKSDVEKILEIYKEQI